MLFISVLAITFHAQRSIAAELCVDDDNTTGVENGSAIHPYKSIQTAIDAAASGDTIKVAAGTYTENINVTDKALTLLGGYEGNGNFDNRDTTTHRPHIQGDGTDAVVTLYLSGDSALDGFRITGGTGSTQDLPWFYGGGGVYCVEGAPTVSNNIIENNDTRHPGDDAGGSESKGGGIYAANANITIADNTIRNNYSGTGGGIRVEHGNTVIIQGNTVRGNIGVGDHGGGMHLHGSDLRILQNIVFENKIGDASGYGHGGGILVHGQGTNAILSFNVVYDNFAPDHGAGEFVDDGATALLENELIYGNTTIASSYTGGSGILVDGWDEGVGSTATIKNCTIIFSSFLNIRVLRPKSL